MDSKFFTRNREKLLEKVEDDSLVIIFAGVAPRKSADENYPFTPNRNFYYLTGDNEEKDILLMYKSKEKMMNPTGSQLFILPFDPVQSRWVGKTYTIEEASSISGVKVVRYIEDFNDTVNMYINRIGIKHIYLDLERQSFDEANTAANDFARVIKEKYPNVTIEDAYPLIAELRMVKEPCEIEQMKKAIHITNIALQDVMNHIKEAKNESNLANRFAYTIFENGASDFAFDTICASEINSTTLHYSSNNTDIKKNSVVLFDLGAEYEYYKSDISRTYPSSGKFSKQQKEIYELVLQVQKMVIDAAKPGLTIRDLNNIVIKFYQEKLMELGYIKDPQEVSNYYFHSVSHHLGLDTHDCQIAGKKLEKGNVITVEPGLYFEELKIGVRIEDNILITEDGCELLSKEIIKEVKDIENFINK